MNLQKFAVLAVASLLAASAQAAILLDASFSENFPFGPFRPNEKIEVLISLTNISPTETVTICEGPCIGDALTYSLGGLASVPTGYTFFFGDKKPEDVFDGQIEGELLPGEKKTFTFGVYDPEGKVDPGFYSFSTQLQIFDATPERLMLATSTFSGRWEVRAVPEPGTVALLGLGLVGLLATRTRKYSCGLACRGDAMSASGKVTVVRDGRIYATTYAVEGDMVHVKTHTETRSVALSGKRPEDIARHEVKEIVEASRH